jgi:hypothetical protein
MYPKHALDNVIHQMQAAIDAGETCHLGILQGLLDIRSEDLQAMDRKEFFQSVWQDRYDNDTQDLY